LVASDNPQIVAANCALLDQLLAQFSLSDQQTPKPVTNFYRAIDAAITDSLQHYNAAKSVITIFNDFSVWCNISG
jgi:hypothetical protein